MREAPTPTSGLATSGYPTLATKARAAWGSWTRWAGAAGTPALAKSPFIPVLRWITARSAGRSPKTLKSSRSRASVESQYSLMESMRSIFPCRKVRNPRALTMSSYRCMSGTR